MSSSITVRSSAGGQKELLLKDGDTIQLEAGDTLVLPEGATVETRPDGQNVFVDAEGKTYPISSAGDAVPLSIDTSTEVSTIAIPSESASAADANGLLGYGTMVDYAAGGAGLLLVAAGVAAASGGSKKDSNSAPVAADASEVVLEDGSKAGLLPAAVDADDDTVTYALVQGASKGAAVVQADGKYTYTPNANANGTDSFTYKVTDAEGASNTYTVSLSITPVNDAPVAVNTVLTIAEDVVTTGSLPAGSDAEASVIAYSLDQDASLGTVVVTADGKYTYTPDANASGVDSFSYQISDAEGASNTYTVSITIVPVNDPPAILDQSFSLLENSSKDSVVGVVLASDVDSNSSLAYAIVDGNAAGIFSIDSATGQILVVDSAALNFEASPAFALTVSVTDPVGASATVIVTVNLVDQEEALASVALSANALDENSAVDVVVGSLSVVNPVVTATFTYSLVDDAGGRFKIVGDQLLSTGVSLDFEANASHSITVKADDGLGRSFDQVLSVGVNDLNEPLTVADMTFSIDENRGNGASVGTVVVEDADTTAPNNTYTYRIVGGNESGAFFIEDLTGIIRVNDTSKLDFETTPSFKLMVEVADAGAPVFMDSADITINLNNLREPPIEFELSRLLAINGGDGSKGFVLQGVSDGDFSGRSVSQAGDFNGDGFNDLIIGAADAEGTSAGKSSQGESYVVFGRADGFSAEFDLSKLDGSNGFTLTGIDGSDFSGISVSEAGDVNGDGFGDLIVGAFLAEGGVDKSAQGESYVVFGSAAGMPAAFDLSTLVSGDGSAGFVLRGVGMDDHSGQSVSGAGDFNGDGYDDLIVGANRAAGADSTVRPGASYVIFGKQAGIPPLFDLSSIESGDGKAGFLLRGIGADDDSGFSVSSAGDINGDGYDDLVVGASLAEGSKADQGESYVVYGRAAVMPPVFELSALESGGGSKGFVIRGIDGGDRSGVSVSAAGDINGDGFEDLIIGANAAEGVTPGKASQGESYVVFGSASAFPAVLDLSTLNGSKGFVLRGLDGGDGSGISVSGAGDVNGDGYDDLIVGAGLAEGAINGKANQGETYVVYGKAAMPAAFELSSLLAISGGDGSKGFVLRGIDADDRSGSSVSAAGDINGDGFDDLLIGAYLADTTPDGANNRGESYVFFGGNFSGPVATIGTAAGDVIIGTSVADVIVGGNGDDVLDGQGGNDVLIGGAGRDVLIYDTLDVLRVDGGLGRDTLRLRNGDDINFTLKSNHLITGIEMIDLETDAVNVNEITLNILDILDLSDSSNDLYIFGSAGDIVHIGPGIVDSGVVASLDGRFYEIYTAAGTDLQLFIGQGLTVV